jgi:hypothetical protein
MKFVLISAIAMLAVAACSPAAEETAEKATAPAAAPAAAPVAAPQSTPPAPTAAELERAKLAAGLSTPFADEAAWVAACKEAGVDGPICDCAGKKTMETIGAKGLYSWIWEGYIRRDGPAQMRSGKFFQEAGISPEDRQKFADAVGKCYT